MRNDLQLSRDKAFQDRYITINAQNVEVHKAGCPCLECQSSQHLARQIGEKL